MSAFWEGHRLDDRELDFWAREIADAALELPEDRRAAFLGAACDGSGALLDRAQKLIADPWAAASLAAFEGLCQPGEVIRDCLVLRPIGRGASGEVYKAIQRSLHRLVAVKVLTGGAAALPAFTREAANTARVLHPNIAAVYDADLHGAIRCIVMEYVDAMSLRAWLDRRDPADSGALAFAESIVRQTALALGEAHRHGLLHRDVKPENILVAKRGRDWAVKIVDFGIARQIDGPRAVTAGTPGYIAPEHLDGSTADGRADIFSLGVVLYELLTGGHPFRGNSDAETYFKTLRTEPELPNDPARARLAAVARRALHKSADRRYPNCDALIADLDRPAAQAAEIGANPLFSEFPEAVQRWCARHSSGFLIAWGSFLWGCASLVLSGISGAACVRVAWTGAGTAHEMIYGYAVEPNAGFWYVAGASLTFLTGFAFLEAAHRGLARAPLASEDGEDPLVRVAARNRRYFRYATPLIVATSIGFVAVPELMLRGNHAFGWVQADAAGSYLGSAYAELRQAGKIGKVAALEQPCDGCRVSVASVANRSGRFAPTPGLLFAIFLASALTHQIVFAAFLTWIGAKMLFFFGLLSTALLGGAPHRLRLTPDFQDSDDYRFGLGQLDSAYYAVLGLAAVGAVGLFLQAAANVSKGTYLLAGDPVPALFGQAVLLLATVGLLVLLLATPASVFLLLTIKAVNEELGRLSGVRKNLERQMAAARSSAEREQLRAELEAVRAQRDTAKQQSLLPIRQPAFIALLAATFLLLIGLPFAIGWLSSVQHAAARAAFTNAVCSVVGNGS